MWRAIDGVHINVKAVRKRAAGHGLPLVRWANAPTHQLADFGVARGRLAKARDAAAELHDLGRWGKQGFGYEGLGPYQNPAEISSKKG